jgi:hypothetical protein
VRIPAFASLATSSLLALRLTLALATALPAITIPALASSSSQQGRQSLHTHTRRRHAGNATKTWLASKTSNFLVAVVPGASSAPTAPSRRPPTRHKRHCTKRSESPSKKPKTFFLEMCGMLATSLVVPSVTGVKCPPRTSSWDYVETIFGVANALSRSIS